jgi:BolA protein
METPAPDRRSRIEAKLREGLDALHVEVVDESHLHRGHAGARGGAGHFRATVVSGRFAGLSRVAAQRLVYAVLADEMGPEIHALSVRTLTPEQWQAASDGAREG